MEIKIGKLVIIIYLDLAYDSPDHLLINNVIYLVKCLFSIFSNACFSSMHVQGNNEHYETVHHAMVCFYYLLHLVTLIIKKNINFIMF